MIAMALSGQPQILIADEPTTALDATIQAQILELLQEIRRDSAMALVLISHDLGVVAENYRPRLRHVCRPHRRGCADRHDLRSARTSLYLRPSRRLADLEARAAGCWRSPASCPSPRTCHRLQLRAALPRVRAGLRSGRSAGDRARARPSRGLHPCQERDRLSEPLLRPTSLVRHYQIRRGSRLFSHPATLRAVDGVSFTLQPGRTLGLVGESGCGKTTTARLVLGLLPLTAGEIRLQGETLPQAGIDALARAAPGHADGLPGSVGGARPAYRRRQAGHGAAGDPRHRRAGRAARQGAGDPAVGRPAGAPLRPLSA